MSPYKFSAIAHRYHEFCNPIASAKIDRMLAGWTRRGGYVLIGEGYWQKPPGAEYLAHPEGTEDEFRDHRGNVQAGIDAGLVPVHASVFRRRLGRLRMKPA